MPSIKQKTHKGVKKRFKVTATGKVTHKRCGSSHLNSHKNGKKIRRLRKKSVLKIRAVAQKYRRAVQAIEVVKVDIAPVAVVPAAAEDPSTN
jgi:large subunit ribosomal protein L35